MSPRDSLKNTMSNVSIPIRQEVMRSEDFSNPTSSSIFIARRAQSGTNMTTDNQAIKYMQVLNLLELQVMVCRVNRIKRPAPGKMFSSYNIGLGNDSISPKNRQFFFSSNQSKEFSQERPNEAMGNFTMDRDLSEYGNLFATKAISYQHHRS